MSKPQPIQVTAESVKIDGVVFPQGKVLGHLDQGDKIIPLEPGVTPGHLTARLRAGTVAVVEPKTAEPAPDPARAKYGKLTKDELKAEATQRGLKFSPNLGVPKLIDLLVNDDADASDPDGDGEQGGETPKPTDKQPNANA